MLIKQRQIWNWNLRFWHSWCTQTYFIATSRELTRLDAVTKAPVIHHFSETIAGFVTIRCFGQQPRFVEKNVDRVNNNLRMDFHNNGANEWIGFRLEMIGAVVLCSTSFLLVSLPASLILPGNCVRNAQCWIFGGKFAGGFVVSNCRVDRNLPQKSAMCKPLRKFGHIWWIWRLTPYCRVGGVILIVWPTPQQHSLHHSVPCMFDGEQNGCGWAYLSFHRSSSRGPPVPWTLEAFPRLAKQGYHRYRRSEGGHPEEVDEGFKDSAVVNHMYFIPSFISSGSFFSRMLSS